jgi:hypothetical protein
VTTTIGCEGIDACNEENLLIADTPESFEARVIDLLRDRARARLLAESGRVWVSNRYDWRKTYQAFDEIYPPG